MTTPVTLRRLRALTANEIAHAIDWTPTGWAQQCHAVSAAIVKSSLFEPGTCRVARGSCSGVGGQHSWVVFGNPYDEKVLLLDCTLWSYDPDAPMVYAQRGTAGGANRWRYRPKGWGSHWQTGIPQTDYEHDMTPAALDGDPLIALFRQHVGGPLSRRWWAQFLDGPVGGWPYPEWLPILAADPALAPLIPVDVLGMGTYLNPGGLYLNEADPRITQPQEAAS